MEGLKDLIYGVPSPPPRTRTQPLRVICVGPPRSATESLAVALRKLGIPTYHGWDILFEKDPGYIQGWARLGRRKWRGAADGDVHISAAEFDVMLGHSQAVIDVAASAFAAQLVEAYPEAKVILNTRRDLDAWHASAIKTIVNEIEDSWFYWLVRLFNADAFWGWEVFLNFGFPGLFRSPPPGTARAGIVYNGKWVYREHCNMIRGLVAKERLLEWSVEDGWAPLCEFLGEDVPNEPFPKTNDPVSFAKNVDRVVKPRYLRGLRNMALFFGSTGVLVTAIVLGVKEGGIPWKAVSDAVASWR